MDLIVVVVVVDVFSSNSGWVGDYCNTPLPISMMALQWCGVGEGWFHHDSTALLSSTLLQQQQCLSLSPSFCTSHVDGGTQHTYVVARLGVESKGESSGNL